MASTRLKGRPKAGPKTTPRQPPSGTGSASTAGGTNTWMSVVLALLQSAVYLILASASAAASQLSLSPVYGSYPAAGFHRPVVLASILGGIASVWLEVRLERKSIKLAMSFIAGLVPVAQSCLFGYSSALGALYGPLVTELSTLALPIFLTGQLVGQLCEDVAGHNGRSGITVSAFQAGVIGALLLTVDPVQSAISLLVGGYPEVSRMKVQVVLAGLYSLMAQSAWVVLVLPIIAHSVLSNVHFDSPAALSRINEQLAKVGDSGYRILARKESVTGYISVVENNSMYRVMRCDHSLLGGIYVPPVSTRLQLAPETNTIYSIFILLGLVGNVEVEGKPADVDASALVIGLGIGTAPTALINKGIDTTIVEIDPVVHEFAVDHFGLPRNHTAVLEDAIGWVETKVRLRNRKHYDYIVHDVFTGGVEPTALFTHQFLSNLADLLTDTGVIVINYAGEVSFQPTVQVISTIFSVFGTCRVIEEPSDDKSAQAGFANMAVFCTKKPGHPIRFSVPELNGQALNHQLRHFTLRLDQEDRTAAFESRLGQARLLLDNNQADVDRYALELTTKHWDVMRTVLPAQVWQLW